MANQQTNQTANQQLRDQLDSYKSRVKKSRRLKKVSFIVGLCLVAVAIVGLVLPAATLEYGKTYCDQEEHTHSEACINQTLVCALPEAVDGNGHVHTPSCYDELGVLACGKTAVAHMHLSNCVNEEQTALICGQEETVHMHTIGCVDQATNTYVCDTEGLAHVHGETCYALQGDGTYALVCQEPSVGHVHTSLCLDPETGEVVCGIEEAIEITHQHTDACYEEELICGMEEHTHNELCYDEITEAIMKNEEKKAEEAQEAAEVKEVEGAEAVEGAAEPDLTAEEIAEAKDQGLLFENDDIIVSFDVPDKYKDDIQLTVTETDDEAVFFEAVDATEEADVEGDSGENEAAQDDEGSEPVFFSEEGAEESDEADEGDVASDETVLDDAVDNEVEAGKEASATDEAANAAKAAAAGNAGSAEPPFKDEEDEPAYKINLHIEATLGGQPVEDIADLGIKAKLQMKPKVIAPILANIDYNEVAPEIKDEVGAEITVFQKSRIATNATNNQLQSDEADEVVATSEKEAGITVSVMSDTMIATAEQTSDIPFTVNYIAPVPKPVLPTGEEGEKIEGVAAELTTINTSALANGSESAHLPKNGEAIKESKLCLDSDGNIIVNEEMLPIYASGDFTYFRYPTVSDVDKVTKNDAENEHYELVAIQVSYAGEEPGDPIEYSEGKTFFTNNPDSVGDDDEQYVLIEDNAVVNLIYELVPGEKTVPASFYDYDVTDGVIYTSKDDFNSKVNAQATSTQKTNESKGKQIYANTNKKGIDTDSGNNSNYAGTGAKLGFGNTTAGTGMDTEVWNDGKQSNTLNKANASGASGCTFGLVSGLEDGKIQYADGVDAPNLFNDGTATGKTTYDKENGSNLSFTRIGDTYTLFAAQVNNNNNKGGNTISGLNSFHYNLGYNNKKIWTNEFWPVDNTESHGTDGHDLVFGDLGMKKNRYWSGERWNTYKTFPVSDDGKDHNAYFGMHYTVDFNLSKDYIGPLEYIFFGDDDLWIFLTKPDGTSELIVDIGGVHSAVGEYVDLWDYINQGSDEGEYKLSVFYTERGASGSTCFMNFTLPSVSVHMDGQDTGAFTVQKFVTAASDSEDMSKEFEFALTLLDGDKTNQNKYPFTRIQNGKVVQSGRIGNGETFKLMNGEFITIFYLPIGTTYSVDEVFTEEPNPHYKVSWKYFENGQLALSETGVNFDLPKAFSGTIEDANTTYRVQYTNTVPYELPATGGIGAEWYWLGGGALVLLALAILWRRQAMASAAATSAIMPAEASVLALFGDTSYASPSGSPESTYRKGRHRTWRGDGQTRKGGRF